MRLRSAKLATAVPLAQVAYEAIREAIVTGKLAPGERVSEYRISEWLQISRTPAREGMQRLQAEGLLATHERGGMVVVSVDEDALRELFYTREVLESALAEQAALNASRPEIIEITRHCDAERELLGQPERMFEHNKVFHELIRKASHNRYLARIIVIIMNMVVADDRGTTLISPERQAEVIEEHRTLAEAIAQRDGARAAQAALKHVRGAYAARLNMPHGASAR